MRGQIHGHLKIQLRVSQEGVIFLYESVGGVGNSGRIEKNSILRLLEHYLIFEYG